MKLWDDFYNLINKINGCNSWHCTGERPPLMITGFPVRAQWTAGEGGAASHSTQASFSSPPVTRVRIHEYDGFFSFSFHLVACRLLAAPSEALWTEMTEVFCSVLKLVQLLSTVIERQDFAAGIGGKEEAPVWCPCCYRIRLLNDKCLSSFSRIITPGSNGTISVTAVFVNEWNPLTWKKQR